jgi:hypothetical protein
LIPNKNSNLKNFSFNKAQDRTLQNKRAELHQGLPETNWACSGVPEHCAS